MRAIGLAILAAISISCGGKDRPSRSLPLTPPAATTDPLAPPATPPARPAVALPAGFPDTVAGHELAWLLDAIVARKGELDVAEVEAHFAPAFLAQVPVDQARAVFAQLGEQVPDLAIIEVVPDPSGTILVARATSKAGRLKISLKVDSAAKQISELLFQADADPADKPTSLADAKTRVATLAPKAQMLIAQLEQGTCKPIHEVNRKAPLAIGSAMKLYVLLGLLDQIEAGKLAWDTELAVRDDWKSLPSGTTQDDPAGTKLPVRTFAERMISISDNTATDHLLFTVGRKKVEAAVKATKHARPALNVPFLATRELFLLKLGATPAEVAAYVKMSPAKRRAFLDGTLAKRTPTIEGADAWTEPRQIDSIEWFASSDDLCRAMAALATRAAKPKAAPVLEVLALNPGLPIDPKAWPYIAFKGGSEPGVMNLTWLLRRDDGKWFVVTFGFNSPAGPAIDDKKVLGLAAGVIELLAQDGR